MHLSCIGFGTAGQAHLDQHVIKLLEDQLPHGLAWLLCELIVPKCLPCLCHLQQQQQLLDVH